MLKQVVHILIAIALGVLVGWLIGAKQEVEIKEAIRYVERPATKIDFDDPTPYKVGSFNLPKLQYHDTVFVEKGVDTTGVVSDYLKRRQYELDFSTDSTGIYKLQATVCCNRLESASATIAPLQREVVTTIKDVRAFRPYIGGGLTIGTKSGVSLEVGALLKERHLPRVGFQRLGNNNYLTIGYGYTF